MTAVLEPSQSAEASVDTAALGTTRKAKIEQLEKHLHDWESRVHELEAIMEKGDSKTSGCCEKERRALLELRQLAADTLAKLRLEEAHSWEEENFRTGVLDIFDQVGRSIDRLVGRIRAGSPGN